MKLNNKNDDDGDGNNDDDDDGNIIKQIHLSIDFQTLYFGAQVHTDKHSHVCFIWTNIKYLRKIYSNVCNVKYYYY